MFVVIKNLVNINAAIFISENILFSILYKTRTKQNKNINLHICVLFININSTELHSIRSYFSVLIFICKRSFQQSSLT